MNSKFSLGLLLALASGALAQKRVINGSEAKPFAYPFIVSIAGSNGSFCGGSLLDDRTILTAAHCDNGEEDIKILVHRHNLKKSESEEKGFTGKVSAIVNHPKYNENTLANDISIWKLESPIPKSINASFVELPKKNQDDSKLGSLTAIGWGFTDYEKEKSADKLQVATLKAVTKKECVEKWKKNGVNPHEVICTLSASNTQSICNGDSGGPLVYQDQGTKKFVQVGLVSFGEEKCILEKKLPDGFTRLASYIDWIEENRKFNPNNKSNLGLKNKAKEKVKSQVKKIITVKNPEKSKDENQDENKKPKKSSNDEKSTKNSDSNSNDDETAIENSSSFLGANNKPIKGSDPKKEVTPSKSSSAKDTKDENEKNDDSKTTPKSSLKSKFKTFFKKIKSTDSSDDEDKKDIKEKSKSKAGVANKDTKKTSKDVETKNYIEGGGSKSNEENPKKVVRDVFTMFYKGFN